MKAIGNPFSWLVAFALTLASIRADNLTDPTPPTLSAGSVSNAQKRLSFTPYPSADEFRMLRSDQLGRGWLEDSSGIFSNLTWTAPAGESNVFHRLQVQPLSSNALLSATVLSKLAYGPTPDLLDRLGRIGPDAFIAEQLNPETILE